MALLELFVASSMPVIKVLLITALGSLLASERIDVLGEDARKHLNKIVFFVFNPALVASNLAKALKHESMRMMCFMGLNILITFVMGSGLGFIIVYLTRAPPHLRGLILGCCAAGNMGNMLFIIIPAVCKEKGTPFGAPDVCQTYGMAYASLSMAIGAIFLWSYVYNMVRLCASNSPKEAQIRDSSDGNSSGETSSAANTGNCNVPLLPPLPKDYEIAIHHREENIASLNNIHDTSEMSLLDRLKHNARKVSRNINFKALFAPSTTAAILGFVVGLVPVLRNLLIGQGAPLHVLQDTALLVGDGSIPSVTLVMGGNLRKGIKKSEIQKSIVIGIIVARYIVLPVIGTAIVKGAIHFALFPKDPLYQFVLLLQYAVPPAMNIATITQLFGAGENECSVIMLWSYVMASVALTAWSTFFMWLVA